MTAKTNCNKRPEYVQYGCGMNPAEGWVNFDASPTLRIERIPFIGKFVRKNKQLFPKTVQYGDIVAGLPIRRGSCRGVYCSHVLEHLSIADCRTALKVTFDLLGPGGTFRAVLPDLEIAIGNYINDSTPNGAISFMRETQLGLENRGRNVKDFAKILWGNSHHLWMWDYKSLEVELRSVGFKEIRRAFFNDAEDEMFRFAEQRDRWMNCLGVECKRPF